MSYEVIEILKPEIACDGGGGALGHPRVYLHTDPEHDNQVTCGYCSRTYVYRPRKTA
jgi:uncharacterized Zn-finger protein